MKIINCDNISKPSVNMNYKEVRTLLYQEKLSVDIIVLSFGRIDKTKNCIESILKTIGEFESIIKLVLIDNGTENNHVIEYYESVLYSNKEVIKLSKNITGVYGLNKVIKLLDSKYLIVVNNDIVVTENWLENLIICAESDDSIGMIVPSSTNISNFQFEDMGGFESIDEMQEKAKYFNLSNPTKWEEKIRLIPTATLYRREIFDIVGLYDLGFMHDFGDDDFSFRVRRAGYKLILCRDTFVHHDHDQNVLPKERLAIMDNSKEFFIDKFNGVDAWSDTINNIQFTFTDIDMSDKSDKTLLAIDVKCGTPVLEIKNFCRKHSIKISKSTGCTSDVKYFIDLQSITDDTICGNIESILIEDKYDYIILGMPLNSYNNPYRLLKKLSRLLNKNGYLILAVKNTNGVKELLRMFGKEIPYDINAPRSIGYKDVVVQISKLKYKSLIMNKTRIEIDSKTDDMIMKLINSMDIDGDKNQLYHNIMVDEYWFTAQKSEE